ncbi:pilM protein [Pseudomonas sp. RW407]|uniref:type IV pilus biogenesis protein PilM n=1 Tax=Pseudomonas sp. RW407 TaxID=2202894 RepID=UPI000D6F5EC9|nr:type IV pilus biogenesis protein PilM [Pseudomonas sp. RW407]PWU32069.1 pilM protein [Pseudomonas sp. RW407]
MYFYCFVLTVLVVAGGILSQVQYQDEGTADAASVDMLSRSMLVYRSAAAEYARNNPGFAGVPADATLNLPSWYSKPTGVTSYLSGGSAYTYFSGTAPAGLPAALVGLTQGTTVGVKRSGMLFSPANGNTGVTIPAAVPEGAVVAIN